jgi:hypothetical protein
MTEHIRKIIDVKDYEAGQMIDYLNTNYGLASKGVFNLGERGEIKISNYLDKIRIIFNCDKKIIHSLQEVIEQNE